MPHTLLLADDSVTIQRVIELTFADEDIRVVAVSDGEQAMTTMNAVRPDIVLADAAMPGRNGYEVAEYMRRTPGLDDVPVLLLTGAFEPIDQARADAARCAGVLVKPFEPQQVISRVQELLTRPPGDHGPIAPPAPRHPPAPEPPRPAATAASIDEYFDRLDKVFGKTPELPAPVVATPVATAPPAEDRSFPDVQQPSDLVPAPETAAPPGQPQDAEVQQASDRTALGQELASWFAAKAAAPAPRQGESEQLRTTAPEPVKTPLAAAFLALLDAERDGTDAEFDRGDSRPSEALIEAVTARVLERLKAPGSQGGGSL